MAAASDENAEQSTTISPDKVEHHQDNADPNVINNSDTEPKPEIIEEGIRGILEVIASTGKFWHDWEKLKSMLSFQLKQVLSEYPEAEMTTEQQNASIGETYPELVKRLDDELHNFIDGPPFTLQRICEILLDARSIYPNISKLALALEKNLLVTSTLTICNEAYPETIVLSLDKPTKTHEQQQLQQPDSMSNGVEPMVGDRDEIMTEVEEGDVNDDMTIDMDAFQDMVAPSEANSTPSGKS